jgi:hypothetical protein
MTAQVRTTTYAPQVLRDVAETSAAQAKENLGLRGIEWVILRLDA